VRSRPAKRSKRFRPIGKIGRTWTLQYLVRHCAFHVLDHAWEMEDKDMSEEAT